jgi:hypothetical protein
MTTEVKEWDGTQPPTIAVLIGLKVERMWELGKSLAIRLEGQRFLRVDPVPFVGDMRACVGFEVGTVRQGADLSKLDAHAPQNAHTRELRGKTFTGIDADIVMFGDYGARVTPTGIEGVKAL